VNKFSSIESVWPKIYNKLKSPPAGLHLGDFPSKLPPMDKIKFDNSGSEPGAFGYVTTEDVDQDGKLDIIHINSPKLLAELQKSGLTIDKLQKIDILSPDELKGLLSVFVELIAHEAGHLKDFKPGPNPFPGGETVADSAATNALNQISVATNKAKDLKVRGSNMNKTLDIIVRLAQDLDDLGQVEAADIVDGLANELISTAASVGLIRPPGDPFSYDYVSDGDYFVVRTAPSQYAKSVGAKFRKGHAAYENLKPYIPTGRVEGPQPVTFGPEYIPGESEVPLSTSPLARQEGRVSFQNSDYLNPLDGSDDRPEMPANTTKYDDSTYRGIQATRADVFTDLVSHLVQAGLKQSVAIGYVNNHDFTAINRHLTNIETMQQYAWVNEPKFRAKIKEMFDAVVRYDSMLVSKSSEDSEGINKTASVNHKPALRDIFSFNNKKPFGR
jgi:hypothetical protein